MFPAMIVYLLLVLIRPQDYPDMADKIGLPLLPIALLVAALFWLPSQRKSFDAPQYALLLAFFGVMLVSHMFNGWFGGALEQLEKFAPVLLAFVVFAHALDSRARILKAMAVFAVCAAVLSLHGIEQVELGVGWTGVGLSQETRIQYVGIFNDPNDLGMLFVICVPMAAYLSSRGGMLGLRRLFWLAVTAILVYGIYLTDSRGSLLGLLVVMGVYVWLTRGLFVAGVLGAAAVAVLLALPSRFQEIDATEASAQGRVESWYEGLQMFREYPLFGVGPDMYTDHHPLTAHNSFVLVLAETGIVGFAIWLAFVVYGFRMMWAGSRPREPWPGDAEDGFEPAHAVAGWAQPRPAMPAIEDRAHAQTFAAVGGHTVGEHVSEGRAFGLRTRAGPAYDPHATSEDAVDAYTVDADVIDADVVDVDAIDETADAHLREGRAISTTLLLSLIGCFTTAFFLSRSYLVVIYLLAAMVVAHYADQRRDDPGLPAFELGREFLRWPLIAVAAVLGLYLMVKVLLALQ